MHQNIKINNKLEIIITRQSHRVLYLPLRETIILKLFRVPHRKEQNRFKILSQVHSLAKFFMVK